MTAETENDQEMSLEMTALEKETLGLYLQVAKMEFFYAVALTRVDHVKQEYFGGKLDAAIDRMMEARNQVDQGKLSVVDILNARRSADDN